MLGSTLFWLSVETHTKRIASVTLKFCWVSTMKVETKTTNLWMQDVSTGDNQGTEKWTEKRFVNLFCFIDSGCDKLAFKQQWKARNGNNDHPGWFNAREAHDRSEEKQDKHSAEWCPSLVKNVWSCHKEIEGTYQNARQHWKSQRSVCLFQFLLKCCFVQWTGFAWSNSIMDTRWLGNEARQLTHLFIDGFGWRLEQDRSQNPNKGCEGHQD